MRHLLEISDFSAVGLRSFLAFALERKRVVRERGPAGLGRPLADRSLAMVFMKPSLRTRVSFQRAMEQLGGQACYLSAEEVGLGRREPARDVARVLGRMCDGVMARVFDHALLIELAEHSPVPVINGLSDLTHPCQTLADLLTLAEHVGGAGQLAGRRVCYLGDPNNVARPLAMACAMLGMRFVLVCPERCDFPAGFAQTLDALGPGFALERSSRPLEAVAGADCLYTDTWVSMHHAQEAAAREALFAGYGLDERVIEAAGGQAVVLHCLPAYRGKEISDGAMEHAQSRVFEQAENRLHAQRALLERLMAG